MPSSPTPSPRAGGPSRTQSPCPVRTPPSPSAVWQLPRPQQPQGHRRIVSTGSIPHSQDPFADTPDHAAEPPPLSRAPVSYPVLPTRSDYTSLATTSSPGVAEFISARSTPFLGRTAHRHNSNTSTPAANPTPTRAPQRLQARRMPTPRRTKSKKSLATGGSSSPEKWTSFIVDDEITRFIRSRLPERERAETGVGENYIFEAELELPTSPSPSPPSSPAAAAASSSTPTTSTSTFTSISAPPPSPFIKAESEDHPAGLTNISSSSSRAETKTRMRLLKIGVTEKTRHTRMAQISRACHLELSLNPVRPRAAAAAAATTGSAGPAVQQPPPHFRAAAVAETDYSSSEPGSRMMGPTTAEEETQPVRLFRRVEKLVHAELRAYQYKFPCGGCKREHQEYFEVDPELAAAVQRRWCAWVAQEPYDKHGNLYPFWEMRLRQRRRPFSPEGQTPGEIATASVGNGDDDEGAERDKARRLERQRRWERRWDEFAHPHWFEWVWYDCGVVAEKFWRLRWQFGAFAQSLALVWVCYPSSRAFVCSVCVTLGIIVELEFQERLYSLGRLCGVRDWLLAHLS
ncbi:uncharacterized protein B0I36DRAFT_389372 [Microdochium trichocladiopsis]|uniref:Bacteriophage T5 Orf172 DNA-binding domain-containing protein n=1 Tax=Microdochium trichocladiopsis TaxID=1682393 RepID=A0A9P9BGA4_9PEZI|nr:uncharacterized protein B0I36DRAFT_389372 [Microdochium trichocladiopsis]KAH7014489.1 hypothetical protein B0I36DRAFT_389372 [Microdochium trichocladiopsis]